MLRSCAMNFLSPRLARLAWALCLGGCFALHAGCAASSDAKTVDNWSPNRLYREARDEFASGNFDKALEFYEKLEGRAAGTPIEQQAKLEAAYTQYRNDQFALALATIDRFMRQHPDSPALDYAYYLKGIVNFQEQSSMFSSFGGQDLSERDQSASRAAYAAFAELVKRFAQSKYAPDARLRMNYIVNALAQHEVNIARYYYERGAYVAAVNRAQSAISEYRDAPALEEAVFVLYQSYDALKLLTLRDDSKRVMEKSFPDSSYLKNGFKEKSSFFSLW